ncbi:MAG: glycosyltransferase [Bacteroidia bacterium]|nr:glycosyltransferase [Bacteroidia bacterium]
MQRNKYKEYFNSLADNRISYRRSKAYYWDSITKYCNYFLHEENSVLEIGCGTGELIHEVKGKRKVGIDFSEIMIENAKKQFSDCEFHVMSAESLYLDEKFDVVILSNLIGWLDDIELVFKNLHSVCHEKTRIIVTYFNYFWAPLIKFAEFIGIKKKTLPLSWLSNKDIGNLLYLSGFDVYRRNRKLLIPYYIPLLSYFFNRIIEKLPLFNSLTINNFVFARPMPKTDDFTEKYSATVVIPARNESGNIENAILRLPKFSKHLEIIFVEGNSTDDTWEKIKEIQLKYKDTHDIGITQQEGKGKGDAVRKGYSIAKGDILMILDADLTVPPEVLPKFYNAIASGKGEFINGSRLVYPMEKNAMRFLNTLGNKFFSLAFTWILEQPIKDTLCGTKVMFRDDYNRLVKNRSFFGDFDPFGDFDLIFGAYKLNLKIIDLPIRYQERTYGETNISRFKHGFLLLKMWLYAAGKIKFRI